LPLLKTKGLLVKGEDGEWETPLVNVSECAMLFFQKTGITKCWLRGSLIIGAPPKFRNAVSCHYIPIRIREYSGICCGKLSTMGVCDAALFLKDQH